MALLAGPLACALGAYAGAEMPDFETGIRPLVEAYCVECHSEDRPKGDLNLDRFENRNQVLDAIAVWQRAAKRMQNGEMPPKSAFQPTDEEKKTLLEWIDSLKLNADDCNQIASEESVAWFPGYVMSRRLNRHEYENTIRDLLGIELDLADMFPADGAGGEGFDSDGSALFLSSIQVEKYLEAADLAIESAPLEALGVVEPPSVVPASANADASTMRDAAAETLLAFASRAWRRPAATPEVERLLELFDVAQGRGDGYVASVKLAQKAVLVSPHFLFLVEPEPEEPGVYELGGYPLASRLSYFLWSTMPDAELFDLADKGLLNDPPVLRAQVQRMLADPKAAALGERFAAQWLGITQLGGTVRPDGERFPEFDASLAEAMRQEVALFVAHVVWRDRSLLELLDADYTIANERLATLYELPGVTGGEMRVVQLVDDIRGGVTGMAAVLTATSHPLRTSPVLRGKWVLEELLGERVPPPPPDAGTLPEDDAHPDGLTLREQLELHRAKPECASCHSTMDPIGFGLENFDPLGRWRAEQAGQPIDARGELPSGESFEGPVELKALLLSRKDDFIKNLSRKMLGYALGRSLTRYDQCVIDDCVAALRNDGYRASQLFTEIALSYPFRHRYSGGSHE